MDNALAILIDIHNTILWRNIEIVIFYHFDRTNPNFPHFYYILGANLQSLLYGDVSVMGVQLHVPKCGYAFNF